MSLASNPRQSTHYNTWTTSFELLTQYIMITLLGTRTPESKGNCHDRYIDSGKARIPPAYFSSSLRAAAVGPNASFYRTGNGYVQNDIRYLERALVQSEPPTGSGQAESEGADHQAYTSQGIHPHSRRIVGA